MAAKERGIIIRANAPHNGRSALSEASTQEWTQATRVRRHPSNVHLADFLLGQCSPGTALLVAQRSAYCQTCWSRLRDLGGLAVRPQERVLGSWTELPGGLLVAPVLGVSGIGEAVYALRVPAGAQLSSDTPFQISELLITDGAFFCDEVGYEVGDFLSIDDGLAVRFSAEVDGGFSAYITAPETYAAAGEA